MHHDSIRQPLCNLPFLDELVDSIREGEPNTAQMLAPGAVIWEGAGAGTWSACKECKRMAVPWLIL